MKKIIRGLDNLLYEIDTETSINLIQYMEINETYYCNDLPTLHDDSSIEHF